MKKIFWLVFLFPTSFFAQISNYYSSIEYNKSGEALKNDLSNLIKETHIYRISYTPGVWNALKDLDIDPENSENVLLIYGYNDKDTDVVNDRSRGKYLTCHQNECNTPRWNREHVYPKSIGEFEFDEYEYSDVHALRASDTNMNSLRFNSPFVDGDGDARNIYDYRFYPGDEWKGDVARMILYMYLRYPSNCRPNYVGLDSHTYHADVPDIFLEWNAEDPVSDFEIRRNNLIEEKYQGNRNPFIDNPHLATKIWGGPEAENRWQNLSIEEKDLINFKFYPNPTTDVIYYENKNFTSIYIFDSKGSIVAKDKNLNDSQTVLPDAKGLYIIEFCDQSQCNSYKVIKQ